MRADDFYFKAGDKVVRVSRGSYSGRAIKLDCATPQYGQVYCVEDFWEGPDFNVIILVGFGGWRYDSINRPIGWEASAFRKVDEIKLCVAAAKSLTQTTPAQLEAVVG